MQNARAIRQRFAGTILLLAGGLAWAEPARRCSHDAPPSVWIVKASYPFVSGTERTYDELYHGSWKARVAIVLYARPNSERVVGKLQAGTVVDAVLGETIVHQPLRFVAAKDFQVGTDNGPHFATLPKGDPFWILDSENEGGFKIWWRCRVVGWDSTEASVDDPNPLDRLGSNEEEWVKVRDRKSGLSGWFRDGTVNDGPQLVPAQETTKAVGE